MQYEAGDVLLWDSSTQQDTPAQYNSKNEWLAIVAMIHQAENQVMGYIVSSLANVPENRGDWHLFVCGQSTSQQCDEWVASNFARLAKDVGPDGVIAIGHDGALNDGLYEFLQKYAKIEIEAVLSCSYFAIISRGHPFSTNAPLFLVPLTPKEIQDERDAVEMLSRLVDLCANAIANNDVEELMRKLGSQTIPLAGADGAIVATLELINRNFNLKPGVFGVGLNINEMINNWLEKQVRT